VFPGGWPELMAHNRSQVLTARAMLAQTLDLTLPCPESMVGSMATLPLPTAPLSHLSHGELNRQLWEQFQVEVPIMPFPDTSSYLIRISAQIYNQPEEFDRLRVALNHFLH
jgi:isopenicillin-N epimerase